MFLTTTDVSTITHLIVNDVYDPLSKSNCFVEYVFYTHKARENHSAFAMAAIEFVLNNAGRHISTTITPEIELPKHRTNDEMTKLMVYEIADFSTLLLKAKNEHGMSAKNLAVTIYHRISSLDYATQTQLLSVIFTAPIVPYAVLVEDYPMIMEEIKDEKFIELLPMLFFYVLDMIEDMECTGAVSMRGADGMQKILALHPDEGMRLRLLHTTMVYCMKTMGTKVLEAKKAEDEAKSFTPRTPIQTTPSLPN